MKINNIHSQFTKLVNPIFHILFVVAIAATLVGFETTHAYPYASTATLQNCPIENDAIQEGPFGFTESDVQSHSNKWLYNFLNIDPFFLQVYIINCTVSGKSIYAFVNDFSTAGYSYLWFTDDLYAGNKSKVECVNASVVKLIVTRLSDGASITKIMYFKPSNTFSTGG